jgi:molecular chaperone GrpE
MGMNEPQEPSGGAAASQEDVDVKWRKKGGASEGTQEPAGEAQSAEGEVESWEERYRQEQAKADDYLARWQRTQADLANLRRRAQQEREETIKRSNEELIRDMLPVLDSFDRALASMPDNLRQLTWIDGIVLVERQLRMALLRHGVAAIEAQGQKFDPTQHEAVAHKATTEHADETITAELQKGYRLHDRVLRPSLVEVANNPGAGSGAQPSGVAESESAL